MRTQRKIELWLMLLLIMPFAVSGQTVAKSVVILNGGEYSNLNDFVTLAAYNPETEITQTIATIFTQSVQGMMVHNGFAYVAAQDSLAKIEIETGEINAIIALEGVNKFAVYDDLLIVSRQFPVTSGFVQVRQVEDLALVSTIDEVSDEAWEITVVGDSAYVSVAGGWAATEGKMAVLDMKNVAFVREVNFGEPALGIGPSFAKGQDLFFVCKTPWGGTTGTIVKYNLISSAYNLHQSDFVFGKAAGIIDDKLYLMVDGNVGVMDLNTVSVVNENLIENPFANFDITALTLDTISQQIYVNYSYWVAPNGVGKIYDLEGFELGEYEIGISAEEVAVNYADATSIPDVVSKQEYIQIYPNPCADNLTIVNLDENAKFLVYDLSGRVMVSGVNSFLGNKNIDVSELVSGIYFLKIENEGVSQTMKFIHQ